jgi:hypothetical protein
MPPIIKILSVTGVPGPPVAVTVHGTAIRCKGAKAMIVVESPCFVPLGPVKVPIIGGKWQATAKVGGKCGCGKPILVRAWSEFDGPRPAVVWNGILRC